MAAGDLSHWVQQLDEFGQVVKNLADTCCGRSGQGVGILGDLAQTVG